MISLAIRLKNLAHYLSNKKTNWELFRGIIDEELNCNIPLKTVSELEDAVEGFTRLVQKAAWESTPEAEPRDIMQCCSSGAMAKIKLKRKIRKQ